MTRHQPGQRSLEGLVVGISVSESSDSAGLGYSTSEINRVTVLISQTLLSEGASLVFGHNWRRDEVMTEIHRLAVTYHHWRRAILSALLAVAWSWFLTSHQAVWSRRSQCQPRAKR